MTLPRCQLIYRSCKTLVLHGTRCKIRRWQIWQINGIYVFHFLENMIVIDKAGSFHMVSHSRLIIYLRGTQIKNMNNKGRIPFIHEHQKVSNTNGVPLDKILPTINKPNFAVSFLQSYTPNTTIRNSEGSNCRKLGPIFPQKNIRNPLKCKYTG